MMKLIAIATATILASTNGSRSAEALGQPLSQSPTIERTQSGAECDQLASAPFDSQRPPNTKGVNFGEIAAVEAIKACQLAIIFSKSEPRYHFQLGRALEKYGKLADAFIEYRLAADAGYLASMSNVAALYMEGKGVKRDTQLAIDLLERAAAVGSTMAMKRLAEGHQGGKFGSEDPKMAFFWFLKASDAGDADGAFGAGLAYMNGFGIEKSSQNAAVQFLLSASRGNQDALVPLANMYKEGDGFPKDFSKAIDLLLEAANAGSTRAMISLGSIYAEEDSSTRDDLKAAKWYQMAALAGSDVGMLDLGILYVLGRGMRKDEVEGYSWIQKAADAGNERAKYYIFMNRNSEGSPTLSTESFMSIISTCATSNKIQIDGSLSGSIASLFELKNISGRITYLQTSDFLSLFPAEMRANAYKMYTGCVEKLGSTSDEFDGNRDLYVNVIRSNDGMADVKYDLFLGLNRGSFNRLNGLEAVGKNYNVSFWLDCSQGNKKLMPNPLEVRFKYATGIFDMSLWLIELAYKLPDDDNMEALKSNASAVQFFRKNYIIAASRIESDLSELYKELNQDAASVFGKDNCSIDQLNIDQFFAADLIQKDGFNLSNYLKISATTKVIMNGKPEALLKISHSNESEYNMAVNTKDSFDYDRYEVFTSGDNRMMLGMRGRDRGANIAKYEPNYVQPSVKYFRSLAKQDNSAARKSRTKKNR